MYENITKKLFEVETVAIFMHINPDGDCIGSSLAMYKYLKNLGKTAHVFLEEGYEIRDNLMFLPNIEVINAYSLKKYDLGIALDCGAASRMGNNCFKRFIACDDYCCFDHHAQSTQFVDDLILEPKSASTTQILYKFFVEHDKSAIDLDVATCLFAGLMTDSGNLSFSSATEESYRVATELVAMGVDNYDIIRRLFKNTKHSVFDLTNRVLSNAKFYLDGRVGIISFLEEDFRVTGTSSPDTEGIINRVVDINEVKLAISIAELTPTAYKIGFRSKDGVNCSLVAAEFGGGGHVNASGCRIYADYETTVKELIKAAKKIMDGEDD